MNRIPPKGPKTSSIFFVGDAPSKGEVSPLSGRAGSLLKSLAAAAGIDLDESFKTNVCQYVPPGGNLEKWAPRRTKNKVKFRDCNEQVLEGIQELYYDLAEVQPKMIIPLDNVALWALTGKEEITLRMGSLYRVDPPKIEGVEVPQNILGLKLMPVLHPNRVLGDYFMLQPTKMFLRRANQESRVEGVTYPERDLLIDPDEQDLENFKEALSHDPNLPIGFDLEGQHQLSCFSWSVDKDVGYALRMGDQWTWDFLEWLLNTPNPKVMQNGFFDVAFLERKYGLKTNNYNHDAMVAHHTLYPELPKSLAFLVALYTREPYYKEDGKGWDPDKIADWEQFLRYAARDAACTLEVWQVLHPKVLKDPCHKETYRRVMDDQMEHYVRMRVEGVLVDAKAMRKGRKELEAKAAELQTEIDRQALAAGEAAGMDEWVEMASQRDPVLNVGSSTQMPEFCYKVLGLKVKRNRKTKRPTTDEDALRELYAETKNEVLLTIIKLRQTKKLISSYYKVKLSRSPTHKNYTFFSMNPVATETGRSSSGKTVDGYGLNLQTIPESARHIYIPPSGYTMFYCDLSQAEARIVAYTAGIRKMVEVFENNLDLHTQTAHLIFNTPYESVDHGTRYLGKRCNHAFNYGMGPVKFWQLLAENPESAVSRAEAKRLRNRHLAVYPELKQFWAWVEDEVKQNGYLINPFNRKRITLGRRNRDTFMAMSSHWAQGTVADVLRVGLKQVDERVLAPLRTAGHTHSRVILDAHDALFGQVPTEGAEETILSIARNMEIPFKIRGKEIVIPVDATMGPNWGDQKKVVV